MYRMLHRAIFPLALCALLIGCADSRKPFSLSSVPCSPPSDLMVPGVLPDALPEKSLPPKQMVAEWGRDLERLQTEIGKRNDLAGFVGEQCK